MRTLGLSCYALTIGAAAALLAGCGGSQSPSPAPGAMPQSRAIATHTDGSGSWMLPEANGKNLLYIADSGSGVLVYSYKPSRIKLVGFLSSPEYGAGECVDSKQDVFITSSNHEIFEYRHGETSPTAVLTDPKSIPINCAVDTLTGNLAVVGYPFNNASYGVEIFSKARGKPRFYSYPYFGASACGYDNKGNLFMDGYVVSGVLNFAELPKGSSSFSDISLNQSFKYGGGIQWDGTQVAIGDEYGAVIYEFAISGNQGTEVGSTPLSGSGTVWQFFIDKDKVIAPSTFEDYAGFFSVYDYPIGGAAKRTIDVGNPFGAVVSRASR
jgi:hypothetical protein